MIEWSNISNKISYYSHEMRDFIPESSGFYAWYFPLWLYEDELVEYIRAVTKVFAFEEKADGLDGYLNLKSDLNWSSIDIKIKTLGCQISPCSDSLISEWNAAMSSPDAKAVLAEAMMISSILMPPLYVGKANNLRSRYDQHTSESGFKLRFESFIKKCGLQISVSDLIFCAVELESGTNMKLKNRELNELVEQVVMRMAAPPYSKQ